MKKRPKIDSGYGARFDGEYTPTEAKRIAIGLPDAVKRRRTLFKRPDEVDPDESLDISSIPSELEDRLGRCFELAGGLIIMNEGWTLVHATLFPYTGHRIYFHAFVQKGGVVYDPVAAKFYNRMSYLKTYYVDDIRTYTKQEAINRMYVTEHYGSWD